MNCWLKGPNKDSKYTRPEWYEFDCEGIIANASTASEIYLGDFTFWHKDPSSFLLQLNHQIDEDCVLYIEGPEIYETMVSICLRKIDLDKFSENVFKSEYKRFLDLSDCREIIKNSDFSILHEDIDNCNFCISFQKPYKKSI